MMSRQTAQNTTQRDERPSQTQSSNTAADVEHRTAPTHPGTSREQAMLYGIVGEQLEQITRHVPLDEPPPQREGHRHGDATL
jgi:xanthine dehydrogenase YagR molybdenum-binding subunit